MWSSSGCDSGLFLRELLCFPICCVRVRLICDTWEFGEGRVDCVRPIVKAIRVLLKDIIVTSGGKPGLIYLLWWMIQALQRSLEAASSTISLILTQTLCRKACKCWTCSAASGQRKKRNQQLVYRSFFTKHCCLYLSSSRFFRLLKEGTKHRKILFFVVFLSDICGWTCPGCGMSTQTSAQGNTLLPGLRLTGTLSQ